MSRGIYSRSSERRVDNDCGVEIYKDFFDETLLAHRDKNCMELSMQCCLKIRDRISLWLKHFGYGMLEH
jgi:hypothetical protein